MTLELPVSPAAELDDASIDALRASLGGSVLRPGDAGYDDARTIFNAMIDRHPALIAQCTTTGDVVKAVNFGREHGLLVSVRGGGHNVAGNAVCEGGLMIDLTPMKGIRVDAAAQTVRAQAGLTWRDFDRETQAFGLASTGGAISSTGIAGLTLGGGFGWLGRSYGMACDNLISADVVLADGSVVTASADEHADLFWGIRGGGGNFGIVTSFEFRLHEVGPMLGGLLLFPFDRAKDVLRALRDFNQTTPDALSVFGGLLTSPEGDRLAACIVCYNGPVAEGDRLIQPLRERTSPLVDLVGPIRYEQMQTLLDEALPFGLQNYWKSEFLNGLPDEAIDILVDQFAQAPSPLTQIILEQFGGAYRRVAADENAFSHRDWDYNFVIVSRWTDPAEAERNIQWARGLWNAIQPYAAGVVYVNYLEGGEEGAARIRSAYAQNYDRMVALKSKYDPTNFFRMNQNIQPAS
jgi:FAD/FMN-containing dehydrogenase